MMFAAGIGADGSGKAAPVEGEGQQRRLSFATAENPRVDAALFFYLAERVRLQVNVENAVNQRYFAYADGNNNISPGSPRAVRVALTTRF